MNNLIGWSWRNSVNGWNYSVYNSWGYWSINSTYSQKFIKKCHLFFFLKLWPLVHIHLCKKALNQNLPKCKKNYDWVINLFQISLKDHLGWLTEWTQFKFKIIQCLIILHIKVHFIAWNSLKDIIIHEKSHQKHYTYSRSFTCANFNTRSPNRKTSNIFSKWPSHVHQDIKKIQKI
jgi:hypothetical protein